MKIFPILMAAFASMCLICFGQDITDVSPVTGLIKSEFLKIEFCSFTLPPEKSASETGEIISGIVNNKYSIGLKAHGTMLLAKAGTFDLEFKKNIGGSDVDATRAWSTSKKEAFIIDGRGKKTMGDFKQAFFLAQPPGGGAVKSLFELFYNALPEKYSSLKIEAIIPEFTVISNDAPAEINYYLFSKTNILKFIISIPKAHLDMLSSLGEEGIALKPEDKKKIEQIQSSYNAAPKMISVAEVISIEH